MFNRGINANGFERCLFPTGYNVPSGRVRKSAKHFSYYMGHGYGSYTHPMRPFVTWSKVEKRFASRKGGSNEVDAVIPKAKLVVTYVAKSESQQSISETIRFLVAYRCHCGDGDRWVGHWPLCCSSNTIVQITLVGVISAVCVG